MVLTATRQTQPASDDGALDRLISATQSEMEKVNALILSRSDSRIDMVPELARYLIDSGGKRLRPMLTIAAAKMFDKPTGNEVRFAAAVEFMHNATLLHDDVVDESKMRRGKPAARMVWGNQASVLVGDFLLGQAFLMMVESDDIKALGILSRAAATIAEGEVFQLTMTKNLDTTPEQYHQIILAKTATLFEAATQVGAMAGGANSEECEAMRRYGLELGCAFQLVDDVLDYGSASGKLGKNTGDDLREGKMTLPIVLALQAANDKERKLISSALGDADADATMLSGVIDVLNKHTTLQQTLEQAEARVAAAQEALAGLPAGETRDLLSDVARFCLERAY